MPPRHVSMHALPHAFAAQRSRCIERTSKCGVRCTIQHQLHRTGLAVHRHLRQKQQGSSCFTASGVHRLCQRSLDRRGAARSSDSMAESQPVSDSDLSQFVDLANELAEVAGSITKKFFRYCSGPCKPSPHEQSGMRLTESLVQRLGRS